MKRFKILLMAFVFITSMSNILIGNTCTMTIDVENQGACRAVYGTDDNGDVVPVSYYCEAGAVNIWGLHDCKIDVTPT